MKNPLPPCGLYRTSAAIGDVPAGRLVYFHNHGDPGPGVYAPASWTSNRATFHERGVPLPHEALASTLVPLPAEGFYAVEDDFVCCEKRCQTFAANTLVQLGYNGEGKAILFRPRWSGHALEVPERGTGIDDERLRHLRRLEVAETAPREGALVH